MVSNTVSDVVLNMILNMVWTWFWTWFWTRFWTWFWTRFWTWFWTWVQVGIVAVFRRSNSLASVSILPVFSRLILDFFLRSSFIRVNVSNSNKISEYSSSEMKSSDDAFEIIIIIIIIITQIYNARNVIITILKHHKMNLRRGRFAG